MNKLVHRLEHRGNFHGISRDNLLAVLDIHTYRPRMREVREGESHGKAWFAWRNQDYEFDSTFNPLLLGACAMVDVGVAMRDEAT